MVTRSHARKVSGAVARHRSKAQQHITTSDELLLVAFDVIPRRRDKGSDKTFLERYSQLLHTLRPVPPGMCIAKVYMDKGIALNHVKQHGGEGIVCRDPDGLYQHGHRAKSTIYKIKF